MKQLLQVWVLITLSLCSAHSLFAAGDLKVVLDAHKVVVDAAGKESLVAADNAQPGDIVQYTATYRNQGQKSVTGLEATIPVPQNTAYIAGSASPAKAKATAGGDKFEAMPLRHTIKREGKEVNENVPYAEYRALRWFPGTLAPGKELKFILRTRLLANETGASRNPATQQAGEGDKK
jgi:uncharacterized repeat protein (TIGR01451 family)